MEHQGTKTIETERLILRKFTADDLSAIFHNWTSDEKVTEFLRWPTHKSIDITKRVLESWLLEYLAAAGGTADLQAKPLQQSLPFFLKK